MITEAFATQLIVENFLLRSENAELKKQLTSSIPTKPLTIEDTVPVLSRIYCQDALLNNRRKKQP